jgi:hypothetical protein
LDLNYWSQIAQILSGITVVAGVIFGFLQFRQYQHQRRDAAALEIMRSFQDSEFTRSMRLLYALPDALSASEFRALGSEHEDAALVVGTRFETMGLLGFREDIPFELLEDLIGGVCIALWIKLRVWAEDVRREQKQRMFLEWFQWLAERLEERGRTDKTPAYERCRAWRPRHT